MSLCQHHAGTDGCAGCIVTRQQLLSQSNRRLQRLLGRRPCHDRRLLLRVFRQQLAHLEVGFDDAVTQCGERASGKSARLAVPSALTGPAGRPAPDTASPTLTVLLALRSQGEEIIEPAAVPARGQPDRRVLLRPTK